MKNKMLISMLAMVLGVMSLTACGEAEDVVADNNVISQVGASDAPEQSESQSVSDSDVEESAVSALEALAKSIVMETSELKTVITEADIEVDRIFYGSFSQEGADEIFVICNMLKMPHVAGLDRKAGILLDADTLQMVAYKEFAADEVVIDCLPTQNGQSRVLFLGTTGNQGMRSQTVCFYKVENDQWVEMQVETAEFLPEDKREAWKRNCFCYLLDERMAVLYEDDSKIFPEDIVEPSELIVILEWDAKTETFVVEKK